MSNAKKITLATITYNVSAMGIGFPWYFLLFSQYYTSFTRGGLYSLLGIGATVTEGIVIAYLYPLFARNQRSFGGAIRFSFLMGSIPWAVAALAIPARMEVNPVAGYIASTTGYNIVLCIVSGLFLGLIYRDKKTADSAQQTILARVEAA